MILMIDLNDDQDATWGGKRTRYIYNYTMQCTDDLISNTEDDSDVTESVHSVQSKTTSNYFQQNILIKYFDSFYFLFL